MIGLAFLHLERHLDRIGAPRLVRRDLLAVNGEIETAGVLHLDHILPDWRGVKSVS